MYSKGRKQLTKIKRGKYRKVLLNLKNGLLLQNCQIGGVDVEWQKHTPKEIAIFIPAPKSSKVQHQEQDVLE